MSTNKLTKVDVINETVEYYKNHERAVIFVERRCVYFDSKTKNMCAVGRCLKNPENISDMDETAASLFSTNDFSILKPEYEHIQDTNFWSQLQLLHDFDDHWNDKELSKKGKKIVKDMIEVYQYEN